MTILFVNGSSNSNGNTAHLAATLLAGHDYETLNLTDCRINGFGQTLPGDQFGEVIERIKQADVVVRYPFGYGLSYTTFDQRMGDLSCNKKTGAVKINVTVTNTGTTAVKEWRTSGDELL